MGLPGAAHGRCDAIRKVFKLSKSFERYRFKCVKALTVALQCNAKLKHYNHWQDFHASSTAQRVVSSSSRRLG